jgi:hypothetical protein
MKKLCSLLALIGAAAYAYAQPTTEQAKYEYQENKYDVRKVDEMYAPKSTGLQLEELMAAFKQISDKRTESYVSTERYRAFIKTFEHDRAESSDRTTGRISSFKAAVKTANMGPLSDDNYRNKLYRLTLPVHIAIDEEWGDDVINTVLTDAYLQLDDYISSRAAEDYRITEIAAAVKKNTDEDYAALMAGNEQCSYFLKASPDVVKDNVQVYFCDQKMFNRVKQLYPQDRLLQGPVPAYTAQKDESQSLMHLFMNETGSRHVVTAKADTKKSELRLNKNMRWYLCAFRGDRLYYSYMVLPCSHLNMCTIK